MRKTMRVPAAAAFLLIIGIASGGGLPELKEGLWMINTQATYNPGNKKTQSTYTLCRSHAYDQHVEAVGKNIKACATVNESDQGEKHLTEIHCVMAGTVMDTKGTATHHGDTSSHTESHTTYTPATGGVRDITMIQDQKYVGSCPAGAQPGDMTSEDGRVNHLWKH